MKKPYSTHPAAVYARHARLLSDDLAERLDAKNRAAYGAKRADTLRMRAKDRERLMTVQNTARGVAFAKRFLDKVQHHLSRGRDAGDIAVRENVRAARVLEAIETLKAQAGGS